jgi:hypothetical protein
MSRGRASESLGVLGAQRIQLPRPPVTPQGTYATSGLALQIGPRMPARRAGSQEHLDAFSQSRLGARHQSDATSALGQQTNPSLLRITPQHALAPDLSRYFLVDDPSGIDIFLRDHALSPEDLRVIACEVERRFGRRELRLTLLRDPDDLDACQLGILIAAGESASDGWNLLQQFDEEWWLDHPLSGTGLIVIDVD